MKKGSIPEIEQKIDKLVALLRRAPDDFTFCSSRNFATALSAARTLSKTRLETEVEQCRAAYNNAHCTNPYYRYELMWMNSLYKELLKCK